MTVGQKRHEALLTACLRLLSLAGIPAWRINQRAFLTPQGWRTGGADPGLPDAIGILPGGKILGLEVKSGCAKLSVEQTRMMVQWQTAGGTWITARSVDDVLPYCRGRVTA